MSKKYLVVWTIDIEADTAQEAAKKARDIQLDPESWATAFEVMGDETGHAGEAATNTFTSYQAVTIDTEDDNNEQD